MSSPLRLSGIYPGEVARSWAAVGAQPGPNGGPREARRDRRRRIRGPAVARSRLLDELYLHVVSIILGAGERLLEGVGDPALEPVKVVASPAVTDIKYRVIH
jgi:hypothetical protein